MRTYATTIKIISIEPFQIYLSGWEHASYVILNNEQKAPFLALGISADWLEQHTGWLRGDVNLGVNHPQELRFLNLEVDDRPTPTDEEFMAKYYG